MADIQLNPLKKNSMPNTLETLQFNLPDALACPKPTELRNMSRDDVRLLVTREQGQAAHTQFYQLANHLQAGDVLVVNTSATQAAAFPITLPSGVPGVVHLSTRTAPREWLAEIRQIKENRTLRWKGGLPGMSFELNGNASIQLQEQYYEDRRLLHLWKVHLSTDKAVNTYMAEHGLPIQYENLDKRQPLSYYQTYFSFHPGSSEMPSAARGFTKNLVNMLLQKGIVFAPILLHTGVSSLEENEAPYPEYMDLSPVSASIINVARQRGNRIVAVGTTAVRAVESATKAAGEVMAFKGYTDLYIQGSYEMKTINALLTGFHEPKASHLHMLQSLAGPDHIEKAYASAIEHQYYWHQFGDLHLILP
mgnify:CR=1 FL=1